jgi:hypothetical protein
MPWQVLVALALAAGEVHRPGALLLPICSNRIINEVVKRSGCTVGDTWCWYRSGGFCTDYLERRVAAGPRGQALRLEPIGPDEVRAGDLAVFLSRAHYALVEGVRRDQAGRLVSISVSEFNFGTCWVDEENLVTEKYGAVNRRGAVPPGEVDGGFLRARPAAR